MLNELSHFRGPLQTVSEKLVATNIIYDESGKQLEFLFAGVISDLDIRESVLESGAIATVASDAGNFGAKLGYFTR